MDNETVLLPEPGTRIHPSGWAYGEWIDVIAAAYNKAGWAYAFGADETGRLDSWNVGNGWGLVVDENIEKLSVLFDREECPISLTWNREALVAFLVANGVTVT